MAVAILDLEEAIAAWSTLNAKTMEHARSGLRSLLGPDFGACSSISGRCRAGAAGPREQLAAIVEPVLALLSELRRRGDYYTLATLSVMPFGAAGSRSRRFARGRDGSARLLSQ